PSGAPAVSIGLDGAWPLPHKPAGVHEARIETVTPYTALAPSTVTMRIPEGREHHGRQDQPGREARGLRRALAPEDRGPPERLRRARGQGEGRVGLAQARRAGRLLPRAQGPADDSASRPRRRAA